MEEDDDPSAVVGWVGSRDRDGETTGKDDERMLSNAAKLELIGNCSDGEVICGWGDMEEGRCDLEPSGVLFVAGFKEVVLGVVVVEIVVEFAIRSRVVVPGDAIASCCMIPGDTAEKEPPNDDGKKADGESMSGEESIPGVTDDGLQ